jgi:excisionase family DNA binding protein
MKTYTIEEAAKYLHMSESSLDDLIATGTISAGKPSKKVVLRESDLDDYLNEIIDAQTAQRREAFQAGRKVHVTTAVSDIRKSRKDKPVLPELRAA